MTEQEIMAAVLAEAEEANRVLLDTVRSQSGMIAEIAMQMISALRAGRKLLFFGNGGSAADAQHIAAEFVGRYLFDRPPLAALALTTDTSALTAIGNDYGFEFVFARQVRAFAVAGDVVVGISTSGNSPNVIRGIAEATQIGATTVGFSGRGGGELARRAQLCLRVQSEKTPHIQQSHLAIAHIICGIVEAELFGVQTLNGDSS